MSNEQTERGKSLIIKGLVPGLTESGKIKIGEKGRMITSQQDRQFQPPKKLDHFRVTTLLRGPDGNYLTDEAVHKLHGEKPVSLPIRLLYDDIELNFQCRYVCFTGKTMWCAGDGEAAWRLTGQNGQRQQVECPCGRQAPDYQGKDRCKINGCLSVIIDGVERVGGVWKLRTTSYNSVVGILSSLSLIKRITGGPLAGIPLNLTLNPKTVITPIDGKAMNIWVVGLEYRGSILQLQDIGYKQALTDARHYERIARIEEEARKLIAHDPIRMEEEDPAEIIAEFYPEQMSAEPAREEQHGPIEMVKTEGIGDTAAATVEGGGQDPAPPHAPADASGLSGTANREAPGPARRRRGNKFSVDATLFGGLSEISTCGCTPDQLLKLKNAAKQPEFRAQIKAAMAAIGYEELSFLRADEAEKLITDLSPKGSAATEKPGLSTQTSESSTSSPELSTEPAKSQPEPATNDNLQCPLDGEWRSRSQHCMVQCLTRLSDGWCPFLNEDPPAGTNLFGNGGAE